MKAQHIENTTQNELSDFLDKTFDFIESNEKELNSLLTSSKVGFFFKSIKFALTKPKFLYSCYKFYKKSNEFSDIFTNVTSLENRKIFDLIINRIFASTPGNHTKSSIYLKLINNFIDFISTSALVKFFAPLFQNKVKDINREYYLSETLQNHHIVQIFDRLSASKVRAIAKNILEDKNDKELSGYLNRLSLLPGLSVSKMKMDKKIQVQNSELGQLFSNIINYLTEIDQEKKIFFRQLVQNKLADKTDFDAFIRSFNKGFFSTNELVPSGDNYDKVLKEINTTLQNNKIKILNFYHDTAATLNSGGIDEELSQISGAPSLISKLLNKIIDFSTTQFPTLEDPVETNIGNISREQRIILSKSIADFIATTAKIKDGMGLVSNITNMICVLSTPNVTYSSEIEDGLNSLKTLYTKLPPQGKDITIKFIQSILPLFNDSSSINFYLEKFLPEQTLESLYPQLELVIKSLLLTDLPKEITRTLLQSKLDRDSMMLLTQRILGNLNNSHIDVPPFVSNLLARFMVSENPKEDGKTGLSSKQTVENIGQLTQDLLRIIIPLVVKVNVGELKTKIIKASNTIDVPTLTEAANYIIDQTADNIAGIPSEAVSILTEMLIKVVDSREGLKEMFITNGLEDYQKIIDSAVPIFLKIIQNSLAYKEELKFIINKIIILGYSKEGDLEIKLEELMESISNLLKHPEISVAVYSDIPQFLSNNPNVQEYLSRIAAQKIASSLTGTLFEEKSFSPTPAITPAESEISLEPTGSPTPISEVPAIIERRKQAESFIAEKIVAIIQFLTDKVTASSLISSLQNLVKSRIDYKKANTSLIDGNKEGIYTEKMKSDLEKDYRENIIIFSNQVIDILEAKKIKGSDVLLYDSKEFSEQLSSLITTSTLLSKRLIELEIDPASVPQISNDLTEIIKSVIAIYLTRDHDKLKEIIADIVNIDLNKAQNLLINDLIKIVEKIHKFTISSIEVGETITTPSVDYIAILQKQTSEFFTRNNVIFQHLIINMLNKYAVFAIPEDKLLKRNAESPATDLALSHIITPGVSLAKKVLVDREITESIIEKPETRSFINLSLFKAEELVRIFSMTMDTDQTLLNRFLTMMNDLKEYRQMYAETTDPTTISLAQIEQHNKMITKIISELFSFGKLTSGIISTIDRGSLNQIIDYTVTGQYKEIVEGFALKAEPGAKIIKELVEPLLDLVPRALTNEQSSLAIQNIFKTIMIKDTKAFKDKLIDILDNLNIIALHCPELKSCINESVKQVITDNKEIFKEAIQKNMARYGKSLYMQLCYAGSSIDDFCTAIVNNLDFDHLDKILRLSAGSLLNKISMVSKIDLSSTSVGSVRNAAWNIFKSTFASDYKKEIASHIENLCQSNTTECDLGEMILANLPDSKTFGERGTRYYKYRAECCSYESFNLGRESSPLSLIAKTLNYFNFTKSVLTTICTGTIFNSTDFTESSFKGSEFSSACQFNQCNFTKACLNMKRISNSIFNGGIFKEINIESQVCFSGITFINTEFDESIFQSGINFENCKFLNCKLPASLSKIKDRYEVRGNSFLTEVTLPATPAATPALAETVNIKRKSPIKIVDSGESLGPGISI